MTLGDERAIDAVATIQGALIPARAHDDDTTLLSILARVERRLLASHR
ncbi:hypothetical protein LQK89_00825 [Curtobacterium sp. C1]|nr:hypothetical protein [Curtobacterium sp. C1]UFU14269.1 hypothetical protein LQK89_00825 [Curtobacterium sp. C1]